MKKYVPLIAIIALIILWIVGVQKLVFDTGCCQVGEDKCASGQGVTRWRCENELKGEFCKGICNTDTGQCE